MADIFSRRKRSEVMSRVRSAGNKSTELRLIALMRTAGITGWRRRHKLPGSPDFVFQRHRVAIFVDGCFWHGCLKCYRRPVSNRKFWDAKLARNQARDREVGMVLRKRGWRVLRIWEHGLTNPKHILERISNAIQAAKSAPVP